MTPKHLGVVGGETVRTIPTTRTLPVTATLDLETLLRAQEQMQLALGSLAEAQGYTGRATLGELLDAWIDSCRRLTETTREGYRSNALAFCRELGGLQSEPQLVRGDVLREDLATRGRSMPVAHLEPALVERAIDQMAVGRWNSVTTSLRACFRWANRHGFAGVGVLVPAARRHKARRLGIAAETWARAAHALYDAFESARPRSRATAAAALCSVRWGVRRGAVVRFEWRQLDGRVGNEILLVDKGHERIVVLDELDLQILAELPRKKRYVFGGRGERGHVHGTSVSKHSRRVLAAAGVDLTLHQAGRHAAGTAIVALGGSVRDAGAHLGHVPGSRVTEERYLSATVDTSRARALLAKAWGGRGKELDPLTTIHELLAKLPEDERRRVVAALLAEYAGKDGT